MHALAIDHKDGTIRITPTERGNLIECTPLPGKSCSRRKWETTYSLDIIERILAVKNLSHLCDEIAREEDPGYVEGFYKWDLLSYVPPEMFAGARVLDFGSGSGSSSLAFARMFPSVGEIYGVELVAEYVELARARAEFRGLENVSFHASPTPESLPADAGLFDYVIVPAVFEHLLPNERRIVMPLVWSHLKSGGILFLGQTPWRWFPVEQHTTGGVPLINYLPPSLARPLAGLRKPWLRDNDWQRLLRRGIRGGSVREILGLLGGNASLMRPTRQGCQDRIDLWYAMSTESRAGAVKKLMRAAFKLTKAVSGVQPVPTLSLAVRKS